jgi:alpha-aminoadipic semialdehyde synthase
MVLWSRTTTTTTTVRHGCLSRFLSTRAEKGIVLGIMSETYNKWERRAPLCPEHVHKLLERNLASSDKNATIQKVLVQPSTKRIFTDIEYEQAGAFVQEDISGADLILGVKRPLQPESMTPGKSYLFFSHTIKGQPENMDLLHYVLEKKIQLFDYECIVDSGGTKKNCKHRRLVAFGKYAGIAGAHDCLFALGRHLLNQGYSTPFLNIPQTYVHSDFNDMRVCLERAGKSILAGQLRHMDPLVFCLTGKGGNVHSGALEVLQLLPYQHITVEELPTLHKKPRPHLCIFIASLETRDLFKHKYWLHFNREHYQKNPFEYYSVFHDTIAPYISVLVNGMYWDERYPRILTKDQMKNLYESGKKK